MQFQWLFTFLSTVGAPLVKKVLVALGIGTVTMIGLTALSTAAKGFITAQVGGMPADVVQLLGVIKFDVAVNIIFSAFTTRATIAGVNKVTGSKSSLGSVGGN